MIIDLIVQTNGCVRYVNTPASSLLFDKLGQIFARHRNSRVDTFDDLSLEAQSKIQKTGIVIDPVAFWANMSLVDPNKTILGPFKTHAAACRAEIQWMYEHNIPFQQTTNKHKNNEHKRNTTTKSVRPAHAACQTACFLSEVNSKD